MITISNISFFRFCLKNRKLDWPKCARTLPVPVFRQSDFTPKRVVVSRLHDTAARFRTGVEFSPRYKNRGELTLG